MKAIDTNILIRFLIGDDELQAKKVYTISKTAESEKKVSKFQLVELAK